VSEHRTHRTRSQIIIAIPHRCFLLPTISWPCQKSDRRGILLRQNQPWTLNISTPNNPLLIPTHHLHLPMPHTSSHPTHSYFQPPPEIWSHDLPHPRKLLLPDDDRFVDGEGRRSRFDVRQRRCRSGEGDGGEERYSELEELHCGLVVCLLACFLVLYCIVLSGVVVGTTVWS
jgi:hypothetical protein